MKDILKIAWRNLWRNKRRTIITVSSIFFAVFFAVLMRSFQLGTYGFMIEQSIESYTGYLQIQNPEYFDDPTIDNAFELSDTLLQKVEEVPNVSNVVPRLEYGALASSGNLSKGVIVSGISPEAERNVSNPYHRLVKYAFTPETVGKLKSSRLFPADIMAEIDSLKGKSYATTARIEMDLGFNKNESAKYIPAIEKLASFDSGYLEENDQGILVSDRLAQFLKVSVGDTIVLMGQGYHGSSAAGLFPIRGIVQISSPDLDNKLIYMSLPAAENYFGMQGQVTSAVIQLKDNDQMGQTQKAISKILNPKDHVVKNWEEITPVLKQQIEGDNVSGQAFVFILYLIVFFGIAGTVLMMLNERKREYAVMIAVGMGRMRLALISMVEIIIVGFLGIISGMLAVSPIMVYFHYNPIRFTGSLAQMYEDMGYEPFMPMALFHSYFFMQGLVVLIMILLVCIIPLRNIWKLDVIKDLRH